MNRYSLTHVPDPVLLRDLRTLLARERATTAELLAHLAEVDDRRLYAPAGHPSMFAWCVEELRLSEDAAFKRIRAARVARRFPALFAMLADGRLHLSALIMLAPHLTPENADDLLAAARNQSKAGIERLLAERFPQQDLPARIEALAPALQLAPGPVGTVDHHSTPERIEGFAPGMQLAPEPVGTADWSLSPGRIGPADAPPSLGTVRSGVAPLAPGRYAFQFTGSEGTYEKLRYAQALLGHSVPSGELAEVFDRALDALIVRLEQRKFAASTRPRRPQRTSENARHVPAEVRRAVWERDGGRCTFMSDTGHRCAARTRLEFDHVEPFARGGRATVKGMRLRCRAHNQYAAGCAFGAGFMKWKRESGQRATEEARARVAAAADVVPWLRALGLRADEARRRAAQCEALPDAPLEERVRYALSCVARPARARAVP